VTELACPGVEQLPHLGAACSIGSAHRCDRNRPDGPATGAAGQASWKCHRPFDHAYSCCFFAFHRIGPAGSGGSDKPEHGRLMPHALAQSARTLTHERQCLGRVQRPAGPPTWARLRIGGSMNRPLAFNDVESHARPGRGVRSRRKKDHPIGAKSRNGLHRDSRRRDSRFQSASRKRVAIRKLAIHFI